MVSSGVTGKPNSFLHISKPEIDLPENTDIYSPAVYAKAAENLARMISDGTLTREAIASGSLSAFASSFRARYCR